MRFLVVLAAVCAGAIAGAQPPAPAAKALGAWEVEYERVNARAHAEPTRAIDRGRVTLRAVGDSVIGELVIGDSASRDRHSLRGTAKGAGWTLYVEDPAPRGFAILTSAFDAAMDWLRASVHGIQPVVVRFDLVARGDSLSGTRSVSGGMSSPRSSTVIGHRLKTP